MRRREAGVEGLDELFAGPTAIAFISGEPVESAKAPKFAKGQQGARHQGGYMDGKAPLSVAQVEAIADLESREVLLAKLAGAMKANLSKAAGLFAAPASQVARLALALQEKRAAEGETLPAAEAPADEARPRFAEAPRLQRPPRPREAAADTETTE